MSKNDYESPYRVTGEYPDPSKFTSFREFVGAWARTFTERTLNFAGRVLDRALGCFIISLVALACLLVIGFGVAAGYGLSVNHVSMQSFEQAELERDEARAALEQSEDLREDLRTQLAILRMVCEGRKP